MVGRPFRFTIAMQDNARILDIVLPGEFKHGLELDDVWIVIMQH